nr:hypothetical protein [Tanacetum cinerariifolium]GEU97463.1 hypothetical protein [Tanacetum cinerariifolium]
MRSSRWPDIEKGIEQYFAMRYSDIKHNLKRDYWNVKAGETRVVETIRNRTPPNVDHSDWDVHITFWLDPKHAGRAAKNGENRARNTIFSRQGSRSLVVLRDQQSDESHEYSSLRSTFYCTRTHDDVWAQEEAILQYEMIKLRNFGSDTPIGVPYTEEHILIMVIKGKQRGHIPMRVGIDIWLSVSSQLSPQSEIGSSSMTRGGNGSGGGADDYEGEDKDVDEDDDEGH